MRSCLRVQPYVQRRREATIIRDKAYAIDRPLRPALLNVIRESRHNNLTRDYVVEWIGYSRRQRRISGCLARSWRLVSPRSRGTLAVLHVLRNAIRLLLSYHQRDAVQLLGRGKAGVAEARAEITKYEEKSPLYGLIIYRRRKVLIKYLPDGTSRLLQGGTLGRIKAWRLMLIIFRSTNHCSLPGRIREIPPLRHALRDCYRRRPERYLFGRIFPTSYSISVRIFEQTQ